MLQQTIDKLLHMHLSAFAQELQTQSSDTHYQTLSFEERLALLVDKEYLKRKNTALQRRLRTANIQPHATVENIDFSHQRSLQRAQFMPLTSFDWLTHAHNLIITGPTGVGKTFLAQALADKACRLEYHVRYIKCHELLRDLTLAKADGTYPKLAARLAKSHLLIIDEWMRDHLSPAHARELLDLFDLKYKNSSLLFVSQLDVSDWHPHIQDPTIADAILDRVVHNAYKLKLDGESLRKQQAGNLTQS